MYRGLYWRIRWVSVCFAYNVLLCLYWNDAKYSYCCSKFNKVFKKYKEVLLRKRNIISILTNNKLKIRNVSFFFFRKSSRQNNPAYQYKFFIFFNCLKCLDTLHHFSSCLDSDFLYNHFYAIGTACLRNYERLRSLTLCNGVWCLFPFGSNKQIYRQSNKQNTTALLYYFTLD